MMRGIDKYILWRYVDEQLVYSERYNKPIICHRKSSSVGRDNA